MKTDDYPIKSARKRHLMLHLVSLVAVVLFVYGTSPYRFGINDHEFILPFLDRMSNPSLYPNDLIAGMEPYYASLLWKFIHWLEIMLPVGREWIFFGMYSALLYSSFLLIGLIIEKLFRSVAAFVFTLAPLLYLQMGLGGFDLISDQLLNRFASLPFLLLAVYLALKNRPVKVAVILALTFLIHPISGLYAWLFFAGGFLLNQSLRLTGKFFLTQLPFFLTVAGFTFYKKISGESPLASFPFLAPHDWYEILHIRSSHHLFPETWYYETTLYEIALILIGLFIWIYSNHPLRKFFMGGYFSIILLLLFNYVFTILIPVSMVIQLSLMRSSVLLLLLSYMTITGFITYYAREGRYNVALLLLIPVFAMVKNSNRFQLIWPQVLLVLAAALLLYIAAFRFRKKQLIYAGIAMVLGVSLYESFLIASRLGPMDRNTHQIPAWKDVQQFAHQHTPVDALFIVPPESSGFRMLSKRASYGDWKDGAMIFYDYDFALEWMQRMKNLGITIDEKGHRTSHYHTLKYGDFKQVSDRFKEATNGIYIVTLAGHTLEKGTIVYENDTYRIYKMNLTP